MGAGYHGGFGHTKGAQVQRPPDITVVVAKTSPLPIPSNAQIQKENKDGYQQIKYHWQEGDYRYTGRWHTQTPNAPEGTGNTWVVQRVLPGIGHGPNARPAIREVMVGHGEWVSQQKWQAAIHAKRTGTLTKEQKELLDHGHWPA